MVDGLVNRLARADSRDEKRRDRRPQCCTHGVGFGSPDVVDHDDTVDHVGEHRRCRTVLHGDGNQASTGPTTHRALNADDAWWCAKTGRDETETAGDRTQQVGGVHEGGVVHARCRHGNMVTPGCDTPLLES